MAFFTGTEKKFLCSDKSPRIVKTILRKNTAKGLILYDFKTYYKTTVI